MSAAPEAAVLPLDGVRVVDVSGPIGAYCTKLLADLGADVIKVEPPGGDELRRQPPFRDGVDGPEASLTFAYYHANKRSLVLDTTSEGALPTLEALGAVADAIVLSPSWHRPVVGFDPERAGLSWAGDDVVVCTVTPYGLTGPYRDLRATHMVAFAATGTMQRMGRSDGPPLVAPGQLHWDIAGVHAAFCIVSALGVRSKVGGQTIEISAQEVASGHDLFIEMSQVGGLPPDGRTIATGFAPTGNWQCRDGILDIAAWQSHHWEAFLEMLGHPDELSEPALQDMEVRREIHDGLVPIIAELLADRSREELFALGQSLGLPTCVLNTPAEFVRDVQLEERGSFVEQTREVTGTFRMPGPAVQSTPPVFRVRRAAPLLGEHNAEIARELAPRRPARGPDRPARNLPDAPIGALDGMRVLSFGTFIAGNTPGIMLAGLGAEVVKIESRRRPEVLRQPAYGFEHPPRYEPSGVPNTHMYAALSRGSLGLGLDLSSAEGVGLFKRLVSVADIVMENFGAKVLASWGCSFPELLEINPRLVMLSLSGYGRTGPRAAYRAYASNTSNFTGLTSVWANHSTLSDWVTGAHGALAVVGARAQVERTGRGVYLDTSQIEAMAAMLAPVLLEPLVNCRDVGRIGNEIPGSLLSGVFPCVGVDRWMALEIEDLADWETLCTFLKRPDLVAKNERDAEAHRAILEAEITDWVSILAPHSAAQALQRAGLAASAVQSSEEAARDPQLRDRHFPVEVEQPDLGRLEHPGSPHRMSKTPGRLMRSGPRLGQHTNDVLRRWLDLDEAELARLAGAGAIFQAPRSRGSRRSLGRRPPDT